MPRASRASKKRNANNGGDSNPSHYYERSGKKVSHPKSKKNPPKIDDTKREVGLDGHSGDSV